MSKTPSIAVIPSGYKASKVYSVLPTNGDADLDFTRNCVATRVNQDGLLEEVGLNVPRLDYSDGGCPSLLLEPQRTNLVTNAIVGTYVGSVDITNKVVSPSGLIDATTPIPTTTSNRFEYTISLGTFATDDILTYSWYRKRISTPIDDSYLGDITLSSLINLETEGVTEQIESDINGFDRFQARVKIVDGALESKNRAYFGGIVGVGNQSVAYYGHQLELGTYATSLIYTSGAEVTRFKDEASKDNLESYINSSEGVLYAEISALSDDLSVREISISDNSTNNAIRLYYSISTNSINYQVRSEGSLELLGTYASTDITDFNKIAVKWKINDFSMWVNGVNVFSESLGETPIGMNAIRLSPSISSNGDFEGKIKDLRVYNEALTDAELITLTTI